MSHFSVLVITDEKPTDESLAAILQPWHEYECTGINDQYVIDVDRTEEALAEFNSHTVTRIKAPDGTLHSFFDEKGSWRPEFSKQVAKPDDWDKDSREEFVPAGYEKVSLPAREVENAADWIHSWYGWAIAEQSPGDEAARGYIEVDADGNVVRCIDRTNPNKKWDWWTVGGRWSGFLRLKPGCQPELGRRGIMDSHASSHELATDIAMRGHVDVETMRAEAAEKAGSLWDKANSAVADLPAIDEFETVTKRHDGDYNAAREEYWNQPALMALKAAFSNSFFLTSEIEATKSSRDKFVQDAADSALCTFAVVKDGRWFERGEMGWFGCASNEKDKDVWSSEFAKLIDDLPSTSYLTVVDCHI